MSRNLAKNPNESSFKISDEEEEKKMGISLPSLFISKDGYVRLSQHALKKIVLQHLISGLDEEDGPLDSEGGVISTISGYTEWQSTTDPAITIGWDWRIEISQGKSLYSRYGMPRSNVMLVDDYEYKDLGASTTENVLQDLIDTTEWQHAIQEYINERYQ